MIKKFLITSAFLANLWADTPVEERDGWTLFEWMETALMGEWTLSPETAQTGTESYRHPALKALVGTDRTGMAYKYIGRETTIQEDLLPDTAKQMVTMYHCKDIACTTLKATHYCTKQNQPEFIANLKESTPERFVFECDMTTELCRSREDHVHTIIHELSQEGRHLKSSYLSWKDGKPNTVHSIYHFDRRVDPGQ